ncbi:hypothetical protein OG985_47505 [Streptomyces sp. NBC_00289]|uniref:hypothetical protein n=1 Tax=Streptomyces sp. NBC_00289 TaxID=2975703 RepID=UPI003251CAFB
MTKTMRLPSLPGAQHSGSAVSRPELEPIFTELAARWAGAGRAVPGRADEEWTTLTRRSPWPVR